jgi:hypothetical protein
MTTNNKKQYAGLLKAQEGTIIDPPKLDIKGLSIKKTTVNKTTRQFFTKLIKDDVLGSDDMSTSGVLGKFREFEKSVKESLARGEVTFGVPGRLNDPGDRDANDEYIDGSGAYKAPYTQAPVRGSIVWNALQEALPPEERLPVLSAPEDVLLFKMKAEKIGDLAPIFGTPQYEAIHRAVFKSPKMERFGFTILAIPKSVDRIPEWLIQFIDMDTIASDNVRNGFIVLESMDLKVIKTPAGSQYSNIVTF